MPTSHNFNVKATQELLLYYLRERASGNTGLRHLAITNLYEWFIFDASEFEQIITANKNLLRDFADFEERRLLQQNTDFFYREIAAPALANTDLQAVHFDLRVGARGGASASDTQLALLYKVLSPPHLLKQPFVNDSNTLDKEFYDELLHIIGLTEVKVKGQKLIQRLPAGSRHDASLLENTIETLRQGDKLANLPNRYQYGDNEEMQLFNVALELVITWINRVLFLKLLEAHIKKARFSRLVLSLLSCVARRWNARCWINLMKPAKVICRNLLILLRYIISSDVNSLLNKQTPLSINENLRSRCWFWSFPGFRAQ
jgi:hypothetical protein